MATVEKKDKQFNKNSYRGLTIEQLEKLSTEDMVELFRARLRRRFSRSTLRDNARDQAQIQQVPDEVQKGQEERPARREANHGQDPPPWRDRHAWNDRQRCWCLQRQGLRQRRNQIRHDRQVPRRVRHLLQAHQARKTRCRSHQGIPAHR